jgi:Flp pilus assembly protein TadG
MSPALKSIRKTWRQARRFALRFVSDRHGVAAIEFAMIIPIMMVLFFGTLEFSSGVAASRKVTLTARTLSDLTSQSVSVANTDLNNFFAAAGAIMAPYVPPPNGLYNPTKAVISELYIDPATLTAKVQWSIGYQGGVALGVGTPVTTVPGALLVGNTYLIYSKVDFLYKPTVGYVMAQAGINLSDVAYTRPRQTVCVTYPTPTTGALPPCPQIVTPP